MTCEDTESFKRIFKEECIDAWTSKMFQCPAHSKTEAMIMWIEVAVLFDNAIKRFKQEKDNVK